MIRQNKESKTMYFEHHTILLTKDTLVSQVAIEKSKTLIKYMVANIYIFCKIKILYYV